MFKIKDAYQMIGTSKIAIERDINERKRSEEEKDAFILEKAKERIKFLDFEFSTLDNEEKRNLNRIERRSVLIAYETIKNEEERKRYNRDIENNKKKTTSISKPLLLDAYTIIGFSREKCLNFEEQEKLDELIKSEYKRKIQMIDDILEKKKDNFKTSLAMKADKDRITEAYKKIENEEARKEYNLQLDFEKRKRLKEKENKYLRDKYDNSDKYNPKILLNTSRAIMKKDINGAINTFYDENQNELMINKCAEISYITFAGIHSSISQYKVIRNIGGVNREFIVYANISIFNMSINKNGDPVVDPEYYGCAISELLSEENLIGSTAYNQGYLGEIVKKATGGYYINNNVEELAAVYKYTGYNTEQKREDRSN